MKIYWCEYLKDEKFYKKISCYLCLSEVFFIYLCIIVVVQSLSHVQLFATLWTAAHQASLSITSSWSSLKLMSVESMMPSNGHPFLLCLQSFPATGSFQMSQFFASGGQSTGVSASSVLPMNIQDWFPFRMDWLDLLAVQGTLRVFSSTTVQKHQFFSTQLS